MAAEQEINIKFVLEVEKYPCLYNYKLPEYVRKDLVDKAWLEIGQKFNLRGAECKEKWRNIRNVFVRNLKPGKSGSGAKKKKPYYLNEVMQFTLPFIKLSNVSVSGNLPMPTETNQIFNTVDSDAEDSAFSFGQEAPVSQYQTFTGSQSMLYNYHTPSPQSRRVPTPSLSPQSPSVLLPTPSPQSRPEPTLSVSSLPTPCPSNSSSTLSNKKGRKTKISVDEGILEYFKTKQARKETSQQLEQQPNKMFLLSLLPDLESMSDRQIRAFKQRVMQLIEEILEDRPSPSSTENSQFTVYYEPVAQEVNTQNTENDNV